MLVMRARCRIMRRCAQQATAVPARAHRGYDPCGTERYRKCDILVTLCRSDQFEAGRSYLGPFIPMERRLEILEILEIQGRDLWTGFLI